MEFSLIVFCFIFVIGLVFGSFLNVVILRTVSGESIVFPGSKCPKCQNPLKWYHNIPLFSYLFLRGKCAFCKEPISIQYPIVELFTGLMFLGLFFKICQPIDPFFGLSVMPPIGWYQFFCYVFAIIVSCLFIAIAGTDILEKKVSDSHTIPLIIMGVVFSLLYTVATVFIIHSVSGEYPKLSWHLVLTAPIFYSVCAGIIGFLFMEAISRLGEVLVGARTFGEGDSYIAAGLGTVFCGLMGTTGKFSSFAEVLFGLLVILLASGLVQVVITMPLMIKKFIVNKNWITICALSVFILYAIAYVAARYLGWLGNMWAYAISTVVLVALALFTCKDLLCGLKKNPREGMYLPFGPAMIIAGFIAFFTMTY